MPAGSTVDKIVYNDKTQSVDIHWHNGSLQTKYSWSFPVTLAQLEQQQWPEGVTTAEDRARDAKAFEEWKASEDRRLLKESKETHEREQAEYKKRADELAAQRKCLTEPAKEAKTTEDAKSAGKNRKSIHTGKGANHRDKSGNKSLSSHSTAGAAAVDGIRPATAAGVLEVGDGQ